MTTSPGRLVAAVVQMSSQADVEENVSRASAWIERAASHGAELVVLPENFAYMGPDNGRRELAETIDPPGLVVRTLAEAARRCSVAIVAGGMPERSSDPIRPHNTAFVIAQDGSLSARYRKIHLFDVDVGDGVRYAESESTLPGDTVVTTNVFGFELGLSICYDVRFPELYRALSDRGAEIIVVPAAFTLLTGKDHWHVLLRARAIEAQSYVLAAAQWGTHPGKRSTYGKSVIVDPWGDMIAQCSEGEGIAVATLDRAYLADVRRRLPALLHRRLR
jgi:predicted amidohydrolase